MKTAYLALGSNQGNRAVNLARALAELVERGGLALHVAQVSSVYQTEPVGIVDQPKFYNLVVEIHTTFSAPELLTHCLEIEKQLGRVRREKWGPRIIDIDLLCFDEEQIESETLSLPHPRMLERAFVLIPLAEIAPRLVLEGETAASRAAGCGDAGIELIGPLPELQK